MRKIASSLIAMVWVCLFATSASAQNAVISGKVRNSVNNETVSAVSVIVKGTSTGTYTKTNGNFEISVKSLPVTLQLSSVGYEDQEVEVQQSGSEIEVLLKPSIKLGQEVVVSASRV
jgi:hypothetical protein